jgi:hypothetical protein
LTLDMIGHPKHVKKALDAGVDIICAQGGEGGGHTGTYDPLYVYSSHTSVSLLPSLSPKSLLCAREGRLLLMDNPSTLLPQEEFTTASPLLPPSCILSPPTI